MVGHVKSWIRGDRWRRCNRHSALRRAPGRARLRQQCRAPGSPRHPFLLPITTAFATGARTEAKACGSLAANGRWYYASFSSQCTTLPVVSGISFVPDRSGTLSRWSSIRLDHDRSMLLPLAAASDAPPKKGETDKPAASPGTTGEGGARRQSETAGFAPTGFAT